MFQERQLFLNQIRCSHKAYFLPFFLCTMFLPSSFLCTYLKIVSELLDIWCKWTPKMPWLMAEVCSTGKINVCCWKVYTHLDICMSKFEVWNALKMMIFVISMVQIVLQKWSPFLPGLERQQYDFKNLQNWSTKCENFTNVLVVHLDFGKILCCC